MRVKKGVTARRRHNKVRKSTKGMQHARRASVRLGKQAVVRSLQYAYRDRRNRKRDMRRLWTTRINAAARENGTTYSALINKLTKSNVTINRKMLSEIAISDPKAFTAIVKAAK